jgi:hypothetical protein
VQKERTRTERQALDAMAEAVAAKSGQAVIALTTYQEQMTENLRAQVAEAETRARVAERRVAETGRGLGALAEIARKLHSALESAERLADVGRELHGALDTALGLARELRDLHIGTSVGTSVVAVTAILPPGPDSADDGDRQTAELSPTEGAPAPLPSTAEGAAAGGDRKSFDDSDETMIAGRRATLPAAPRRRAVPAPH